MSTHTHEVQTLPLTLGAQFQAARERTGMKQEAFGEWLGTRLPRHRTYTRTAVSLWETDRTIPPFDVVAALSEEADWPIELFMKATPPSPDTPPGLGIASRRCSVLTLRPRIVEQEPVAA